MSLNIDISRILRQYGATSTQPDTRPEEDFERVAQNAQPDQLREGLSEAFRSDQTPPFAQMISQLFAQGSPQQRVGMLNHLLAGLAPSSFTSLLVGNGAGVLGTLLGQAGGNASVRVSEQDVSRIAPEQVEAIAARAERNDPGIIEHMSAFYAAHPALIKSLGGTALAVALGKMANRNG